jgi:hypothetical protein
MLNWRLFYSLFLDVGLESFLYISLFRCWVGFFGLDVALEVLYSFYLDIGFLIIFPGVELETFLFLFLGVGLEVLLFLFPGVGFGGFSIPF